MRPDDIDRVFGRGRLKMATGEHVEVYREESQPGERRRYTKRFLSTTEGDFRHWTEREWRILARLVGHRIGPVPDVVQFDRGAGGRTALVQTYDAGVTVDHWATLLPVHRDGHGLRHVFQDCAHWWALARHCLVALDAIHELHVVHLDIKADNVCIPVGPPDFDPWTPGQVLRPVFGQVALIDFAFSLVSGEPLGNALPIGRQEDYDYQSPRLLQALEAGRRGDLQPTRQLDWRCDIFSLAAMLARYLPDADVEAGGWTGRRLSQAQDLVDRLFDAHHRGVPAQRPHRDLIERTASVLRDEALSLSLERGWLLSHSQAIPTDTQPTPVTRIAMPLRTAATAIAAPAAPVRNQRSRAAWWVAGVALVGAASVPFLGEAWRQWLDEGAPQVAQAQAPVPSRDAAPAPVDEPRAAPAPVAAAEPASAPVAAAPAAPQVRPPAPAPRATPHATPVAKSKPAVLPSHKVARAAAAKPARSAATPVVVAKAPAPKPPSPASAPEPVAAAPAPSSELPPPFPIATLPPPAVAPPPPASAPARVANDDGPTPSAEALPGDFTARGQAVINGPLPRAAQRAERLVLRVLHLAGQADLPGQLAQVTEAARELRMDADAAMPPLTTNAHDARQLHEAASAAFWNGHSPQQALSLQLRAFGADPTDPEIAGNLAFLYLKQRRVEAETARQLALYALAAHDAQFPTGRIEDWTTLAIASALSGRTRDARNAWYAALALAPSADRACRAAVAAYVTHGEAMRMPAEALLTRVRAWGRSQESTFCRWPPNWSVGVRAP